MIILGLLVALIGCAAAAFGIYLFLLACASFRYSQTLTGFTPHSRLTVLVPAHDEETLVGRTVRSLREQSYPRELYEIAVIADNCSDATATVARDAGADLVLVRDAPEARGKGHALRWAMDRLLSAERPPDAIVSVDADTIVDRDLLLALSERLEAGAPAVQADYRAFGDGSEAARLREVGFVLMNRARPAGRHVLGLSACLVGNGWLLSSELLRRRPWAAFTSTEDREYSIDVQLDGARIAFAGAAAVHAPTAPTAQAAETQQLRWEGGWASLLRGRLPQLLSEAARRRSVTPLMVAFDLAVPPLGLLAAWCLGGLLVSGALTAIGACPAWAVVPWLLACTAVPMYVLTGLVASDVPSATYRALLHAPLFVLTKPLSLRRTLGFRGDTWVRTERANDGVR